MTTAQVAETSATTNILSEDCTKQTTDTQSWVQTIYHTVSLRLDQFNSRNWTLIFSAIQNSKFDPKETELIDLSGHFTVRSFNNAASFEGT